jgi:hypothetical protein
LNPCTEDEHRLVPKVGEYLGLALIPNGLEGQHQNHQKLTQMEQIPCRGKEEIKGSGRRPE